MRSGPDNFLTLYKYRSLAEPHGRSDAENIILHNRLFWQSPITFNDPFDCSPFLFYGNNTHERNDYARRAASSQPGLSRTQRRMKSKEIASTQTDEHEANFRTKWKNWMGESAVACFSGKNDHPLMWSHYANSHRGICFIFQEQGNPNPWFGFDVIYSIDRPKVNLTEFRNTETMEDALLKKSSHWSYEHEHRMIEWRSPPGFRNFPKEVLKGIILGAKIGFEDEKFILSLIRKRPHLNVYRANADELTFDLNIVQI